MNRKHKKCLHEEVLVLRETNRIINLTIFNHNWILWVVVVKVIQAVKVVHAVKVHPKPHLQKIFSLKTNKLLSPLGVNSLVIEASQILNHSAQCRSSINLSLLVKCSNALQSVTRLGISIIWANSLSTWSLSLTELSPLLGLKATEPAQETNPTPHQTIWSTNTQSGG